MDDTFALFQLRLPIVNVLDLKAKLAQVVAAHDRRRRGATEEDRTRKLLTMNNLMRLAFVHGAVNVVGMKDEAVIKHLAATGITRGPRAQSAA